MMGITMENNTKRLSKIERQQKIRELLSSQKKLNVREICKLFNISEATARRDIESLLNNGSFTRFHGGILLGNYEYEDVSINTRKFAKSIEKSVIGKAAAELVDNGETIFLASGTSILELAKNLHKKKISVVTNSLLVMNELVNENNIELISTGGIMRRSERSFIGHISQKSLEEITADKVFLGTYAIDPVKGLTHDYLQEIMTDRAIMRISENVIILADHSKFERSGNAFLAPISKINTVITDTKTDPAIIEQLNKNGVRTIIAK